MTAKDYILALPEKIKKHEGMLDDTTFQFDISGDGGGQYTLEVKDGAPNLKEGLVGDPKCSVKSKDDVLVGIITGKTNAAMAVMMGKIKISNLGEMMKFKDLFSL